MRQKEKKTANQKQHQLYEKTRKDRRACTAKNRQKLIIIIIIIITICISGCMANIDIIMEIIKL